MNKPVKIINEDLDTEILDYIESIEQQLLEAKARVVELEEEKDELLAHLECVTSTSNITTLSVHAKASLNNLKADAIEQAMPDRATVDNCNYSNAFRIGWNTCLKEFSVLVDNLRNSVKEGEG